MHRGAAVSAIAGAVLLITGTVLHPSNADPDDPRAAFAEYAADRLWVASHLLQLFGLLLIVFALIFLARLIGGGSGANLARLGSAMARASLAVAAVLQAVDGIALKKVVDAWAAAGDAEKEILFQSAFAVRQVEVGLAAILSLFFGIAAVLYGAAVTLDRQLPAWLGWTAFLGGIPTFGAGVAFAYTGFSGPAMTASMSGSVLLIIWVIMLGVWMWRRV